MYLLELVLGRSVWAPFLMVGVLLKLGHSGIPICPGVWILADCAQPWEPSIVVYGMRISELSEPAVFVTVVEWALEKHLLAP